MLCGAEAVRGPNEPSKEEDMLIVPRKLWAVHAVSAAMVAAGVLIVAGPQWAAFAGVGTFAVLPARIITERILNRP